MDQVCAHINQLSERVSSNVQQIKTKLVSFKWWWCPNSHKNSARHKIWSSVAKLCWNKAGWLPIRNLMTIFNHSECFISEKQNLDPTFSLSFSLSLWAPFYCQNTKIILSWKIFCLWERYLYQLFCWIMLV